MNLVVRLRRSAGLTQAALAELSGTSQPTIAAYETGTKRPSLRTLQRMASAVGLGVHVMFVPQLTREDRRSLALHERIADRLRAAPTETLARARANILRMRSLHPRASELLDEWERLLSGVRSREVPGRAASASLVVAGRPRVVIVGTGGISPGTCEGVPAKTTRPILANFKNRAEKCEDDRTRGRAAGRGRPRTAGSRGDHRSAPSGQDDPRAQNRSIPAVSLSRSGKRPRTLPSCRLRSFFSNDMPRSSSSSMRSTARQIFFRCCGGSSTKHAGAGDAPASF